MTNEEYERIFPVIDMAQRLHHKLAEKLVAKGVAPIDVLIASLYATHNLATALLAPPFGKDTSVADMAAAKVGGIEWMRTAIDNIERQVLAASEVRH